MPKAVDKHPQARGLGNALWNPLRSGVAAWSDPMSAIDDTAQRVGGGIRARIDGVLDDVVEAVEELTGIDISTPVALLEQLLAVPLGFLSGTSMAGAMDALGQFLPWLPGVDPDDFDPADAATELVTSRLLPTGLLAGLVGGLLDEANVPDITRAMSSDLQSLLNAIKDGASGTAGSTGQTPANALAALQAQFTALGGAQSTATTAIGKAQGWIDGFWNGFTGKADSNVPVADAQSQAAAISETQAALAAAVNALQAASDGATNQGVSGTDTFDRVTSGNLGGASFWNETWGGPGGASYLECNGSDAVPVMVSGGTRYGRFRCLRSDIAVTLTDYQKITWTAGSVGHGGNGSGVGESTPQKIRLEFRENVAETQYGFVEIGGTGVAQWGYRNGGAETLVGSPVPCALPGSGTQYSVIPGTSAGVRRYRLYRNATFIDEWNDSGNLVAFGPNNRGWGWGVQFGAWTIATGTPQVNPPSCGSVSVADNVPPTIFGTTFSAYRANTGTVNFAIAASSTAFPSGTFDTVEHISGDLAWDPSTNTLTNNGRGGTFLVGWRIEANAALGASSYVPTIHKGGTEYRRWREYDQPLVAGSSDEGNSIAGFFQVYLGTGQSLQPARINGAALNVIGNTAGSITYIAADKI